MMFRRKNIVKSYAEKNMWFRPYDQNFFLKVINTNYFTD